MQKWFLLFFMSVAYVAQTNESATDPIVLNITKSPRSENDLIGPANQPEWTTKRRFSTTRVYIQRLPGEVGFEQWWRGRFFRDGTASHLMQEEVEIGLPFRTQLDLYENWNISSTRKIHHHDFAAEVRWALADWGVIPLNPTLYGEWKFVDEKRGPDVFEIKLLLGEDFGRSWHWGFNAAYEQEFGASRATELAWSQGISYSLKDSKFGIGAEMKFSNETEAGSRSKPEIKFLLGPSLQYRPSDRIHLDVVPLMGLTHDAPRVEAYIILGIDLWKSSYSKFHYTPSSLKGQ